MKKTNKRSVKSQTKKGRKRVSYVSRKRGRRVKKLFSFTEKTTEPNIMVNHTNHGGIINGLRAFLGKKNI